MGAGTWVNAIGCMLLAAPPPKDPKLQDINNFAEP
jgi:hypothetical protein